MNKTKDRGYVGFFVLCLLAASFLFMKSGSISVGDFLWAEDGVIFIKQAREVGTASIFQPYAGYLHAYPRLIALISSWFSLWITPYIFFISWLLPFYGLLYVSYFLLIKNGFPPPSLP